MIHAIMLSDYVMKEEGTGKTSLLGCFGRFNADRFPFTAPQFFVTVFLANMSGKPTELNMAVRIEEPKTSMVLSNTGCKMELSEDSPPIPKEAILDFTFPFPNVIFQQAGIYDIKVFFDGDELAKRHFVVAPISAK